MPLAMVRPQAVVIGDKVYVSGGAVNIENDEDVEDNQQVFQYDPSRDEWNHLPPHHVFFFAMAQFSGHLITVGGGTPFGTVTGNVCIASRKSGRSFSHPCQLPDFSFQLPPPSLP